MRTFKRQPSFMVMTLALALHVGFWWLLRSTIAGRPPAPAPAPRITVRLQSLPAEPAPPAAASPSPTAETGPRPRSRTIGPRPTIPAPAPRTDLPPATPLPSVAVVADPPTEAAASAPRGDLLDTPASRRAIREAAHARSLAERSAQLSDEPARLGADQRLGNAIAAGAKGDCDKGEYVGGGMGLLSLPFWAVARLREQCSK